VAAQEAGTFAERDTGNLCDEVLDEEGNPGQRAGRWCRRGRGQRLVVHRGDDRVEGRVELDDPFDRPLDQFGRGDLAAPDEVGLRHCVERRHCGAGLADGQAGSADLVLAATSRDQRTVATCLVAVIAGVEG
jgi:hypothetical protein